MSSTAVSTEDPRSRLVRRGRALEYVTIGWNVLEAIVSVAAGVIAGSVSLIGFGADSLIESSSGLILLWRLRDGERGAEREERALRLVGVSFLALAGYVAAEAGKALWLREAPEASPVGIAIAALSLVAMPVLARAKRRVAGELSSNALAADARQTDLCAYLSAILLAGLLLNAVVGWWWADPVAALAMVPIIVREGVRALRGQQCGDCHCAASSIGPSRTGN